MTKLRLASLAAGVALGLCIGCADDAAPADGGPAGEADGTGAAGGGREAGAEGDAATDPPAPDAACGAASSCQGDAGAGPDRPDAGRVDAGLRDADSAPLDAAVGAAVDAAADAAPDASCQPTRSLCELECGVVDDGCGALLPCGQCPEASQQCVDNQCRCVAATTACEPLQDCGSLLDECGEPVVCGPSSCSQPAEQCIDNRCTCIATTTACPAGHECGVVFDECGAEISCGPACAGADEQCVDHRCVCVAPENDCPGSWQCGSLTDSCGGIVVCSSQCSRANDECVDHQCQCTPTDCTQLAEDLCGRFDDGCGSTLDCACAGEAACIEGTCQDAGFDWVRVIGGNGIDSVDSVATHTDGSFVVTGVYSGGVNIGGTSLSSPSGMFLVKYDSAGAVLWVRGASSTDSAGGAAVAQHSDGSVVVTGSFRGTATFAPGMSLTSTTDNHAFLARYDADGTLTWLHEIAGEPAAGDVVGFDGAGAIVVAGGFAGSVSFDTTTSLSGRGPYVAKYDAAGSLLWAVTEAATDSYGVKAMQVRGDGAFVLGGSFAGSLSLGETPNAQSLDAAAYFDGWLASYGADGQLQWANQVATTGVHSVDGVLIGGAGEVYATGRAGGSATFAPGVELTTAVGDSSDIFLVRYDDAGDLQWLRSAGGSAADEGVGLDFDAQGDVLLVANFLSSTVAIGQGSTLQRAGSWDLLFARYTPDGELRWAARAGGAGSETARAVGAQAASTFIVVGGFPAALSFGVGEFSAAGGLDGYVARFGL